MGSKNKDGGPAFPVPETFDQSRDCLEIADYRGMSLLDFFASQAMKSLIRIGATPIKREPDVAGGTFDHPDCPYYFGSDSFEVLASDAYSIAVAMLAERESRRINNP